MSKNLKNSKKQVLTEDLFNSNGDANITNDKLNELVENIESTKEVDKSDEKIQQDVIINKESFNSDIIENIDINENLTNDLVEQTNYDEISDNVNKENIESNDEIATNIEENKNLNIKVNKRITTKFIKKMGFDDESLYE